MDSFKNVFSLSGKTALVIGAGGLGLPIARALMQNGADIVLADMKEPDGAFAEDCRAEGRQCFFVPVNLLDEESVVKMVAEARQKTGRIGTDQDYTAYCASKGAVNMYTKQLACEWGKYGITANAIAPTFTRTPINSFQLDDPVFYKTLVDRIPRGRICTARDLGCAAVFLCSDAAEFISGQVLCVDGGLTAKQ